DDPNDNQGPVTDDVVVTVNPAQVNTYTLSITSENGSVELDPPGGTYDEGTEVSLRAIPDEGYQFDHWSGDLDGNENPKTLLMDSHKSVTA
ncbi:MAG: hypothetical protein COW12_06135, partial [Candidatus Omnitrophica bacterium CG12_big_fil_rev_8_21_14_0_65_45_16]